MQKKRIIGAVRIKGRFWPVVEVQRKDGRVVRFVDMRGAGHASKAAAIEQPYQ